ncbi:CBS domain-containing protein [Spongiactinospora sp. TRM90649]|uniref:CBS domain-containing protein n=1 Tax=Spongiactinospora sp. TRM90649 TaxID=3031114 RepID=UPI0023F865D9|nr:CBS domain-containing protein [Spongiactinospora sp. TRM90649]MDF5754336.1 CBS domain-containing protein [Spongiactinospora sp. TRM90649]
MWTKVEAMMSRFAVAVLPDTPFTGLIAVIRQYDVGTLTVVDAARRPVGVVSEHDLLVREADPYEHPGTPITAVRGGTAGELMTTPPVTVTAHTTVREAARVMLERRIKQLPVVDADTGVLVGTIHQRDLLKVFSRPPEEVRGDVEEMLRRSGVASDDVEIDLVDGVVTLTGRLARRSQVNEVLEAVRGVEGVVAVDAALRYATDDLAARP